nr:ABC transporter permease subunit [uncultured Eisenbergiella sp.]
MEQTAKAGRNAKKKVRLIKRYIPVYLMALPGILYLFINNYMPLPGLVLAFKKYSTKKGIWGSPWIGFKNFKYLFKTQDAWIITRNTLGYNILFIFFNVIIAVAIAILLSEITTKWKKWYQSTILLPHFLSTVIISYLVFAFLSAEHGFLNTRIFPVFGIEPVSWYTETKYWPFILVFVQTWRSVGYSCIVYLSTILGFDREIYEASAIDGASKWQQITKITLPLLRATIIMMVLLAVGRIFYSDFGLFYQVPQRSGILLSVTQTIDTYVYRGLLERNDMPMATAAGVYQSIVGFILVMSANLIVRKIDPDSALF